MQYRILVVDDLQVNLDSTRMLLTRWGYEVDTAQSGAEALEKIVNPANEYALILLDYKMPGKDGAAVAREIRALNTEANILIFSADDSRDALKEAWMAGAVGFLEKSADPDTLKQEVENYCRKFEETTRTLKDAHEKCANAAVINSIGMAGCSNLLADSVLKAIKYRDRTEDVLILGETGTGKELIARALHTGSKDNFLVINCATYQGNTPLLESELFGYEKGAFTGAAVTGKVGLLESARGGTVFFDEIHRLSVEAQWKLLRAIQERKIRRVGGNQEYTISFRTVAAAKPDIEQAVEDGTFIPDLYYRLNVLSIPLPALRERVEDVAPLVSYFVSKHGKDSGKKRKFLMRTIRYLEQYPWPGNVRELENTVRKLLVDTASETITPEHLNSKFFGKFEPIANQSSEQFSMLERRHEQEKKQLVATAMNMTGGNAALAAKRLGVPKTTMYDLIEKYGIQKPNSKAARAANRVVQESL